ncbi:hypothetical protein J3A83DRAFT_4194760 [Scleroderma citrinum]
MAPMLSDEFDSPIFSVLSEANIPAFHFKRVDGPIPDLTYYEISFHHANTLVVGRGVFARVGVAPHKWIIEYQADQDAYTILNLPIWPSTPWTVNTDKKYSEIVYVLTRIELSLLWFGLPGGLRITLSSSTYTDISVRGTTRSMEEEL